jgi:long-chain fatty acid transport protein
VAGFASSTAETIGFSAEGVAMGNAMVSIAHDWSSVYYNIAGLGRTTYRQPQAEAGSKTMALRSKSDDGAAKSKESEIYPNEIYLGFMYTYPMFEIDINRRTSGGIPQKTNAAEELDYAALMVGVAFDVNNLYKLPEKIISSCRLGLGLVTNGDLSVAQVNDVDMRTHNWLRYGREAKRLSAFVGLGIGFMKDMIGIGIGVNASFVGEGKVSLDNVAVSGAPQVPEGQTKMALALSPFAICGLYFDFGRVVPVLEGLSIGSAYRQESYLEIDPFPTLAIIQNGNIQMTLLLAIFDYYSPHMATWGISYSRWGVTLAFDMEHQLWSRYKVSSKCKYTFENRSGIKLPDYDDIFVYKVGISYDALKWLTIMVGYTYQPTFVPDKSLEGIFNVMDNNKHIASLGASFTVGKFLGTQGPIKITVAYQFQYLEPRDVVKNQTQIVNDLPASYPYYAGLNPNYSYGGMVHTALLGIKFML